MVKNLYFNYHWTQIVNEFVVLDVFEQFQVVARHWVKSVRIRRYSSPYFPAFVLSTERYFISFRIQTKCRKIRTRITPNTVAFYAVRGWSRTLESLRMGFLVTIVNDFQLSASITKSPVSKTEVVLLLLLVPPACLGSIKGVH